MWSLPGRRSPWECFRFRRAVSLPTVDAYARVDLPGAAPPEPRHSIADLLTLVGAIRRIAYDVTLEAGDAMRRIRDALPRLQPRLTRTTRRPVP
jgi:hypothetical protein